MTRLTQAGGRTTRVLIACALAAVAVAVALASCSAASRSGSTPKKQPTATSSVTPSAGPTSSVAPTVAPPSVTASSYPSSSSAGQAKKKPFVHPAIDAPHGVKGKPCVKCHPGNDYKKVSCTCHGGGRGP